jgi:hypothetical protein
MCQHSSTKSALLTVRMTPRFRRVRSGPHDSAGFGFLTAYSSVCFMNGCAPPILGIKKVTILQEAKRTDRYGLLNNIYLVVMSFVSSEAIQKARRIALRGRSAVACIPCKEAKTKCNDYRPCNRCSKLSQEALCTDEVMKSRSSIIWKTISKLLIFSAQ